MDFLSGIGHSNRDFLTTTVGAKAKNEEEDTFFHPKNTVPLLLSGAKMMSNDARSGEKENDDHTRPEQTERTDVTDNNTSS